MRARSSPTRRSTTSADRSMCTRMSAAAASVLARPQRVEDLQVLLDRRLDPVHGREVVDPDHADALVDVVQVALGRGVARRVRERFVERLVGVHEVRRLVALGAQLQPLLVQRLELLGIGGAHREVLEHGAHGVQLAHRGHARRVRPHAAGAVALDVAVALQPAQRLAHGRAARVEALGELLLDEPLAVRERPGEQRGAERAVDVVSARQEPAPRGRRPAAAGA